MLACLAASILMVGIAFNLPITDKSQTDAQRFTVRFGTPPLGLSELEQAMYYEMPLMTHHATTAPASAPMVLAAPVEPESSTSAVDPEPVKPRLTKLTYMPIVDFAELMPEIRGGLAAYYIHIEYPEEAKMLGIEGRLVLAFVVEPDGSTSDIRIVNSLHPLCDSAAVRALRHTSFIPGQHEGQPRRVRMRLPVRFVLVDPDSSNAAVSS